MARRAQQTHFLQVAFSHYGSIQVFCNRILLESIGEFEKITDLFLALLYPKSNPEMSVAVDSNWHKSIFEILDQIYSAYNNPKNALTQKQLFMLHQQIRGNLVDYNVTFRKDRILEPMYREMEKKGFRGPLDTFDIVFSKVHEYDISVPVLDFYSFDTQYDFDMWVFQQVIDGDLPVKRCKFCNKFFFSNHSNSNYCCKKCKQLGSNASAYGGFPDLSETALKIFHILRRKEKSNHKYCYTMPALPPEFDSELIFAKAGLPINGVFRAQEFRKIRQAFSSLNDQRRADFVSKYSPDNETSFPYEEWLREKDIYLQWLNHVHTQMKSFSFSEKNFLVLGIPEEEWVQPDK